MTKHDTLTPNTTVDTQPSGAPQRNFTAEFREKKRLQRERHSEAVAALRANPFYMIGAKLIGIALLFVSLTVVLAAVVVGLS